MNAIAHDEIRLADPAHTTARQYFPKSTASFP
jgi:hypothetical protein